MPNEKFEIHVPLDASQLGDEDGEQVLQVVGIPPSGEPVRSEVKLAAGGRNKVSLAFGSRPGRLQIVVGPVDASLEQLLAMQTVTRNVSLTRSSDSRLTLSPIVIGPYYWHFWPRWCRRFVIRGRVLCADGSAVPGAEVCASDLDG